MLTFNNHLFRTEMLQAIRQSFLDLKGQLAGERLYGFSVCLESLGSWVGGYGNSYEGLRRIVETYRQKGCYEAKTGDLTAHLTALLKWNCEDGWVPLNDPYFTKANQILRPSYVSDPDAFYETGHTRLVYLACLAALAENDAEGVFGRGEERDSLTLNLYLGDQSHETLLGWAVQVNPYEVYERFRAQLAGESATDEQLIYSAPGKRKAPS